MILYILGLVMKERLLVKYLKTDPGISFQRGAVIQTREVLHLLDHTAPLAALLKIPLLVEEDSLVDAVRRFYPDVSIEQIPLLATKWLELGKRYDALFQCAFWIPPLTYLFQETFQDQVQLVFVPHGQSDKGYRTPVLDLYPKQPHVLLYGDLQETMLKELSLWPLPSFSKVGNYRLHHYLSKKKFYDDLGGQILQQFPKKQPLLLYAPTWSDPDQSSSFFSYTEALLKELPETWNLVIKLHPLLEAREPALFYSFLWKLEKKTNVLLLSDFPPVYPLLNAADAYLGDFSSVGYDFLFFEKPMFFCPDGQNLPSRLRQCGTIIDFSRPLEELLQRDNPFREAQRNLYHLAFGAKGEPQRSGSC